jgi:hypothetical protein
VHGFGSGHLGNGRCGEDYADAVNPPCLLPCGGERCKKAEYENDREPDYPHEHLGEDGWQESSRRRLVSGFGRVNATGLQ